MTEHRWHICYCPAGPMFPRAEVEAARRRVETKRAIRRALAAAGFKGVIVR